jgi:acyl carrier protein
MSKDDVYAAVQEALVGALGIGEEEVTPNATLLGDLNAESIDLLDILFRIERKLGVKIQASDLGAYVQGGIPDEEFGDKDGKITPKGMAQLKKAMPQIDVAAQTGKLQATEVMSLFTVQNLADMVAQKAPA